MLPLCQCGMWNAECGIGVIGRASHDPRTYIPHFALRIPHYSCSPRVELARTDPRRGPFDVGGEGPGPLERLDRAPDPRIPAPDPPSPGRRPQDREPPP